MYVESELWCGLTFSWTLYFRKNDSRNLRVNFVINSVIRFSLLRITQLFIIWDSCSKF